MDGTGVVGDSGDAIDWATDYDIFDPRFADQAAEVYAAIRNECPVGRSERYGGSVMPVTYDAVASVAYDTENFSSVDVGVAPIPADARPLSAPPITSDPPFHTDARRLLLPSFSVKSIDALETHTRQIANDLLDEIAVSDRADAAAQYAQHIPVRVIGHMLGLPESDHEMFFRWAITILQEADDSDARRDATREVLAYFAELAEQRRQEPGDDLMSLLIDSEMDGAPLTNNHIIGSGFLLLLAGMDTTWSAIGSSLLHLAANADDRQRLVDDPDLIETAIEEFLRAYAPVTMARVATNDTEIAGCPVHAGEKVLLPFPAGNRDPEKFDRPDEVLIDREQNRHFAFGIGIHRCLGSNLARMEMQVAVEEWLARFPNFELDPERDVVIGGAQVRGPRVLPVLLNQHAAR